MGSPSVNQRIAQLMRVPVLGPADLAELAVYGVGLEQSTPLWYYVLKEADVGEDGQRLGPVGGRIVGEVGWGASKGPPSRYGLCGWRASRSNESTTIV
jgi:hypothetical protein